mgnify:CR=1 FL=1
MKIKYLVGRSGPNLVINPGDTATVSTEKGKRLIDQGYAEAATARKKVEVVTTEVSKPSTKSKKAGKKK